MMCVPLRAIVPHSAAPPPPKSETPAELAARAGADSGYYSGGEQYDKSRAKAAQAWRQFTPAGLVALVDLHQRHFPGIPLPAEIQRRIGRAWGHP
jgi:hypothetical protein